VAGNTGEDQKAAFLRLFDQRAPVSARDLCRARPARQARAVIGRDGRESL